MQLASPIPLQSRIPVAARPGVIRPYAVFGAHVQQPLPGAAIGPRPVYNPVTQTSAYPDGTPLATMATSQKTSPDGDIKNPPPADEGGDPGVIE
ncbi:hypothetical protein [Streptomyces sp. NPDC097640]|uniref:hypothetical protein n=1 Tax=Streptomyces sp. NPDC097640 TaxID=3157229 RepID=UPI0033326E66